MAIMGVEQKYLEITPLASITRGKEQTLYLDME
jgi:hypothetical protein